MPVILSGLISGISENGCGLLHARGMNIEVAGTASDRARENSFC